MAAVVTVNDVLDGDVGLDVECIDGSTTAMPICRSQAGGVVYDRARWLYDPVAGDHRKDRRHVRKAVERFAADNTIPVVRFGKHDRKIEVIRAYRPRRCTGRSGVAAIGIAQEFKNVFASAKRRATRFRGFRFTRPTGG